MASALCAVSKEGVESEQSGAQAEFLGIGEPVVAASVVYTLPHRTRKRPRATIIVLLSFG